MQGTGKAALKFAIRHYQRRFVLQYVTSPYAVGMLLTSLIAFACAAGAQESAQHMVSVSMLDTFTHWLVFKFEEFPEIFLGVAMALAGPPIALAGWLMRRYAADPVSKEDGATTVRSLPLSGWKSRGVLILEGDQGESHEVGVGLLRIGRAEDNDVQLMHNTVHRYHAIVQRTPEAEFYVSDISGPDGNGIRVDGKKIKRSRLRGHEDIEVGSVRLRFQLAPVF